MRLNLPTILAVGALFVLSACNDDQPSTNRPIDVPPGSGTGGKTQPSTGGATNQPANTPGTAGDARTSPNPGTTPGTSGSATNPSPAPAPTTPAR
jgi:hypothetical protein